MTAFLRKSATRNLFPWKRFPLVVSFHRRMENQILNFRCKMTMCTPFSPFNWVYVMWLNFTLDAVSFVLYVYTFIYLLSCIIDHSPEQSKIPRCASGTKIEPQSIHGEVNFMLHTRFNSSCSNASKTRIFLDTQLPNQATRRTSIENLKQKDKNNNKCYVLIADWYRSRATVCDKCRL